MDLHPGNLLTFRRWPVPALLLGLYLMLFLILPVGTLMLQGLSGNDGHPAIDHLRLLADNPLYLESLGNSLTAASGSALLAALAALPVAMLLWRYNVRLPMAVKLSGILPLFIPPFILSLSLQTQLGRGGTLGQLLAHWGDFDPASWGLPGVVIIEALHYFPMVLAAILLTTSPSSHQAGESACLGSRWSRLIARVFLPMSLPGLALGMAMTFLRTLDDLATPLSLGVTNLLAPQVFFRVSTYGAQDPLASLMAILMFCVSGLAWAASIAFFGQRTWLGLPYISPSWKSTARPARSLGLVLASGMAALYIAGYSGTILMSIAQNWSYSALPDTFVLTHYLRVIDAEQGSFLNTLLFCGFAAILDVATGILMALAIEKSSTSRKKWLSWCSAGLLSIPGVTLAIAYLQFFNEASLPFANTPLDTGALLLPLAFSIRGLPFAILACRIALQSLPKNQTDAAAVSGRRPWSILSQVILPAMSGHLLVALVLCFGIAAVDLSTAMLLVPSESKATVSYSLYLHMQTTTGRGTASALAILFIVAVTSLLVAFAALMHRPATNAGGKEG